MLTSLREGGKTISSVHRQRTQPKLWHYDYLVLRYLYRDILALLGQLPKPPLGAVALDVGTDSSPYRRDLERRGFQVLTLDLNTDRGADLAGTAETTGLEHQSVDLVFCTQVLEHTRRPWVALQEFHRILRPGGFVLFTVPHVWFYHPHPSDFWRLTAEGASALCEDAGLTVLDIKYQGNSATGLLQVVAFLAHGTLGAAAAPLNVVLNTLGVTTEHLIKNQLFALNVACLSRKE